MPKEELNSYRPISNLSFISKILEEVVANRLRSHIYINGLSNVSQSAYCIPLKVIDSSHKLFHVRFCNMKEFMINTYC